MILLIFTLNFNIDDSRQLLVKLAVQTVRLTKNLTKVKLKTDFKEILTKISI